MGADIDLDRSSPNGNPTALVLSIICPKVSLCSLSSRLQPCPYSSRQPYSCFLRLPSARGNLARPRNSSATSQISPNKPATASTKRLPGGGHGEGDEVQLLCRKADLQKSCRKAARRNRSAICIAQLLTGMADTRSRLGDFQTHTQEACHTLKSLRANT